MPGTDSDIRVDIGLCDLLVSGSVFVSKSNTTATKGQTMTTITPNTDPATLDEAGRQALSMVTIDRAHLDATLELIDADDWDDLSPAARVLADDYGVDADSLDEYTMGAHLEGLLDWRVTLDSSGVPVSFHLLVAFGGPNVWHEIDGNGNVEIRLAWWGTTGRSSGHHDFYAAQFEFMSELFACCGFSHE